jgi:hypothetical protein
MRAIQDKKKFDTLISDLDFLVTNLEKVSGRLETPSVGFISQGTSSSVSA